MHIVELLERLYSQQGYEPAEKPMDRITLPRKRRIFNRRQAAIGDKLPKTTVAILTAIGLLIGIILVALDKSEQTDSATASRASVTAK